MTGEIKSVHNSPLSLPKAGEGASRAGPGARSAPPGDRVSLTDAAMNLGNLERTLAATPVMDGARVEAVRESLAEGSYVVDPVRVADKLIQFEMMLGRGESRQ